jgi:hypothetical protein
MEMPTIGREMQRMTELFAGTWRGEERLFPSEWDPVGGPAVGTWTVRPAAGGFALSVEYVEERDGKVAYQGHGVHAQDARDGQLYAFWFDNIGMVPKAGVAATLDGDRYTYTEASPMGRSRFTYAWQDGGFTFAIDRSTDGVAWKPMHAGTYRRV